MLSFFIGFSFLAVAFAFSFLITGIISVSGEIDSNDEEKSSARDRYSLLSPTREKKDAEVSAIARISRGVTLCIEAFDESLSISEEAARSVRTLSISLHAPNDRLRSSMMPVNDAYPVKELIAACRRYQQTTGRRISFEYSLVRGVNDSDATARELADLIRGMGAHVNLIPINPVDGSPYSATDAENVRRFQQTLTRLGVNATVRRRLGSDISAACGQLRRDEAQRSSKEAKP